MKIEKKEGPAKCWKCGRHIKSDEYYYRSNSMVGRPSFHEEQFVQVPPQFCEKCSEKVLGR